MRRMRMGLERTNRTPSNLTGPVRTCPCRFSPCPDPLYRYCEPVSAFACRAVGLSPELDCLGYCSPYQVIPILSRSVRRLARICLYFFFTHDRAWTCYAAPATST